MRLVQYLSHTGAASRRRAAELIKQGRVTVDGEEELNPARQLAGGEVVALEGRPLALEKPEYYAVHKPLKMISAARDTHNRPLVIQLVDSVARLYPVGRLDADTSGLLLLTNDGEMANQLIHPRYAVPKTYEVRLWGNVTVEALKRLREGVQLEDGLTAPATASVVKTNARSSLLHLTIREGRNRQVRRMCDAVGFPVDALKRISFGPIRLGKLPVGESRTLTAAELRTLRGLAAKR